MPAYVFTGLVATAPDGTIVRQIKDALSGVIGGYIESTSNLDPASNAWVEPDGYVWGGAVVNGDAVIRDDARVYGDAQIGGNAVIGGDAVVRGRAEIEGDSLVTNGIIQGNACLHASGSGRHRVYYDTRHFGCRPWTGKPL